MIEGHVLQQLGGLWRWLQDQSPARQALILATPVVAAMLLVLGGLIVWTVAAPTVAPRPTAVVQASLTAVPPTNVVAVIATASSSTVAQLPTVLVPSREPALTPTVVP